MQNSKSLLAIAILFLTACVGTDFIEELAMTVPARVVINPTNTAVEVGKTTSFQAAYYDSLGNQTPGIAFQWSSSDPSIASIDANGQASGKQTGQARITARALGVRSEPAILTVVANPNQVARVVVMPDSGNIAIGGMLQFTAVAQNLNGEVLSGKTVNWLSSEATIVSVSNTGLATGLKPGKVNIIAVVDGIESPPAPLTVLGTSRSGTFTRNPNTSYNVSGTASLEQQPNGDLVLRLGSDFSSSNGPGLEVFLSTTNAVGSSSRNLGRLQQTSGAQSYNVPAGVTLTTYNWVIIHCVPFNVTFGYAQLR
ncbi:MAG: DM13 domain-containing protein [candidate division KSB1 bacterium]|nr:DM13 domain-containing protein [candidate division KSB1 bacterium]